MSEKELPRLGTPVLGLTRRNSEFGRITSRSRGLNIMSVEFWSSKQNKFELPKFFHTKDLVILPQYYEFIWGGEE